MAHLPMVLAGARHPISSSSEVSMSPSCSSRLRRSPTISPPPTGCSICRTARRFSSVTAMAEWLSPRLATAPLSLVSFTSRLSSRTRGKPAQPCEFKACWWHQHPRDEGREVSLSRPRRLRERLCRGPAEGRRRVSGKVAGLRLEGSVLSQGRGFRLEDEAELVHGRDRRPIH